MLRAQIQLTPEQHRQLRRWARHRGVSVAEAVRRCIDETLAREEAAPTREARVRAALAVCGKYHDPKGPSRVAREHDRHLAEAFGR
jgi:hypothetical protein